MRKLDNHQASEDLFSDTRMTFGEHIEDLRTHLLRAIYGFLAAMLFSFIPGWTVLRFIAAPVEVEVKKFYDERTQRVDEQLKAGDPNLKKLNEPKEQLVEFPAAELAKALGVNLPEGSSQEWVEVRMRVRPVELAVDMAKSLQLVNRRPGLSTLSPVEAFTAYIKVCLMCGLVLSSPWVFYQIWSFIAAGLYPSEKRIVNLFLPISVLLFIGGVLFCQFVVLPKALDALLWFNYWLDLEPDLRFNEWLGFAILLPVLFGISCQLPIFMLVLDRVGLVTRETFIRKWRMAIFSIFVFAALLPTLDVISLLSLGLTMCALYGLGLFLCSLNPRRTELDIEPAESGEVVEV